VEPSSDLDVTAFVDQVRTVATDIEIASARIISGHGQNNVILIVNESHVFRFPLYEQGIANLEREIAILRGIRRHVSLATPDPVYVSLDDRSVGKVFLGYPMIPGEPLWRETLDRIGDVRLLTSLGTQVGAFLKALHAVPVSEVLPDEAARFDPLLEWKELYRRISDRLFTYMRPDARSATVQHFESFFQSSEHLSVTPALIHGDFGTGNILVDLDARRITGVIDFGGAGVGDPAVDFAAVPWSPAAFYDGLVGAYPEVATAGDRVKFYRGTFALQEALFGLEAGMGTPFGMGSQGINRATCFSQRARPQLPPSGW